MSALIDAWAAALAAEHRACFAYSVLGPSITDPAAGRLARACQSAHDDLRDRTARDLTVAGGSAYPQVSYPDVYDSLAAHGAPALAVEIEEQCAAAWRYLITVAATPGTAPTSTTPQVVLAVRTAAQRALTDSALRAMRWRVRATPASPTVAFPGLVT